MYPLIIQTPKGLRLIGPGNPAFIVAEMSGNHAQDLDKALAIVDAAAHAGVDALKMQTSHPDGLTIDSDKSYFRVTVNTAWAGQTLHELCKKIHTPWEWQPKIKTYAERKGLTVFSTPFDPDAVDFLETIQVPLYKIASFEVCHLELLKRIGATKKPVILSRGMASESDLWLAIETLRNAGTPALAILQCVSAYPASPEHMNLATIRDIQTRFQTVSGLSDHSLSPLVPLTAIGLGASVIEKHLTLRRSDGGPDAAFSLEPGEMQDLVQQIRMAERTIGQSTYAVGPDEKENLLFRRSLFVTQDIKRGDRFTRDNVRCIRPGHGLPPQHMDSILGKTASADVERGTPLQWTVIDL